MLLFSQNTLKPSKFTPLKSVFIKKLQQTESFKYLSSFNIISPLFPRRGRIILLFERVTPPLLGFNKYLKYQIFCGKKRKDKKRDK